MATMATAVTMAVVTMAVVTMAAGSRPGPIASQMRRDGQSAAQRLTRHCGRARWAADRCERRTPASRGSGTRQVGGSELYSPSAGVVFEGRVGVDTVLTWPVGDLLLYRERAAPVCCRGVPRDNHCAVVGDPHPPHL